MEVKSQIIDVNASNFEKIVMKAPADVLVVVDFWAPWCGPCKTLGPVLEQVVVALGPSVVLAKVNVDDNQDLAAAFRVQGIPAVKLVRSGQLVDEFTGALPKADIEAMLRRHVADAPASEEEIAMVRARHSRSGAFQISELADGPRNTPRYFNDD